MEESLKKNSMESTDSCGCGCGHDHHEEHEHEEHAHEEHHHHDDEHCGCGCEDHEHEHHHHDHDDDHCDCGCEDHEHEHHEHEHHHDGECGCGCGHDHDHEHHHHHHADEVFTSWGRETIKTYSREDISRILKTLEEDGTYGTVLRAKGMVAGADGEWIYFDMVPQEHEVRSGAAEYTGRICVIGSRLEEDKLEELFGLKK